MSNSVDTGKLFVKFKNLQDISLSKPLEKAAMIVENAAKVNCPVDKGQLRASITHSVDAVSGEAEIGTNVEYAPYVEFGTGLFSSLGNGRQDVPWVYQDAAGNWHSTSGQLPQPFLEPALTDNKAEIQRVFSNAVQEELANNARL